MSYHSRCGLCNVIIRCNRFYRLYQYEYLFQTVNDLYQLLHCEPLSIDIIICGACKLKHERRMLSYNRNIEMSQLCRSTESMDIEENVLVKNQATETIIISKVDAVVQCSLVATDTVSLPVRYTTSSHKYCVICHSLFDAKPSVVMPANIRLTTLIQHAIYLRPGVRCCENHLDNNGLKPEALNMIKANYAPITSLVADDVINIIDELTSHVKESTLGSFMYKQSSISFDNPFQYSDHEYHILTGIYKSDFDTLCQHVEMRNTDNRSISMAIGCLLVKLRLGLSNSVIATLVSIDDRRTIRHIIESARKALMKHFVPSYLGFHHVSRETFIKCHTRPLAKQLLTNGNDVAILDATYLYVQKSANNMLQRKLFSLHKHRPLIKPMIIVATDGYIVSAIGPYYADWRNNDANITDHLLRTNQEDILNWLKANDTLVVDRGFRDVLDFVSSLGFNIYMPSFLPKSKKQYTVSYLVTKLLLEDI